MRFAAQAIRLGRVAGTGGVTETQAHTHTYMHMCGGIINAKEAKEWKNRKNEQARKTVDQARDAWQNGERIRRRGRTLKLSRVTFHELAKCNKLPQPSWPSWHVAKLVGNRQKGFPPELNMPRNLCGFHRNSMAPKGVGLSNLHA